MSMQLYIIYDNTTLDFQADGYKVVDGFYPETPDEGAESVTDQFNVLIKGSTPADLHSKINTIRLALEHAKEHKDDALAAWIYYEVDNSVDAWMTKLLGGMVMYDTNLSRNWRHKDVIATIIIERKPYWDAKDEVQVPLTNGNGTDDLSGLTVFNHDDAGTSPAHDNWVSIEAADIEGDLPGPTRLEAINSYASDRLWTLWIGQNWTDPDNFPHILEGEASSIGTPHSIGDCSGGQYIEKSLATGAEAAMFTWALSAGLLNASKGQYYKIMARFYDSPTHEIRYRLKLEYKTINVWQSGQMTLDASRAFLIRDMFTLRLPPWLLGHTDLSDLTMTLTGQHSLGSNRVVNIDFLQLTPLDGWRMLDCVGYGAVQNERFIDDGFNEVSYIDDGSGGDKAGILVGYGNPITLYPGKKQRLYFLMHSNLGIIAEIARTISVKLYYRPRRQTL